MVKRKIRVLVTKPGLDGHSNGAEQVALMARDAGFEVIFEGIRQTPDEIANTALQEGVHAIGLSVLSGSHMILVGDVIEKIKSLGLDDVPILVGGIIPPVDHAPLLKMGVSSIYTPKDYRLDEVLEEIANLIKKLN